jgi:hypothetical protein
MPLLLRKNTPWEVPSAQKHGRQQYAGNSQCQLTSLLLTAAAAAFLSLHAKLLLFQLLTLVDLQQEGV